MRSTTLANKPDLRITLATPSGLNCGTADIADEAGNNKSMSPLIAPFSRNALLGNTTSLTLRIKARRLFFEERLSTLSGHRRTFED
jgi:hypothetical protein